MTSDNGKQLAKDAGSRNNCTLHLGYNRNHDLIVVDDVGCLVGGSHRERNFMSKNKKSPHLPARCGDCNTAWPEKPDKKSKRPPKNYNKPTG